MQSSAKLIFTSLVSTILFLDAVSLSKSITPICAVKLASTQQYPRLSKKLRDEDKKQLEQKRHSLQDELLDGISELIRTLEAPEIWADEDADEDERLRLCGLKIEHLKEELKIQEEAKRSEELNEGGDFFLAMHMWDFFLATKERFSSLLGELSLDEKIKKAEVIYEKMTAIQARVGAIEHELTVKGLNYRFTRKGQKIMVDYENKLMVTNDSDYEAAGQPPPKGKIYREFRLKLWKDSVQNVNEEDQKVTIRKTEDKFELTCADSDEEIPSQERDGGLCVDDLSDVRWNLWQRKIQKDTRNSWDFLSEEARRVDEVRGRTSDQMVNRRQLVI